MRGGRRPVHGRLLIADPHHHVRLKFDAPEKPTTQLSWEAAPGKTTNHLPEFHDAPLAQRKEFQDAMAKAIQGRDGEDLIADCSFRP